MQKLKIFAVTKVVCKHSRSLILKDFLELDNGQNLTSVLVGPL